VRIAKVDLLLALIWRLIKDREVKIGYISLIQGKISIVQASSLTTWVKSCIIDKLGLS